MSTLRIFVPSSARLLTDRQGHGEGLIAWDLLTGLAARGHELVVCARVADTEAEPPFELIVTGLASRFQSIEPLAYMRRVSRICRSLGGASRFDLAHWLFPTGPADTFFVPPRGLPLVVGPQSVSWPTRVAPRPRRLGDVVRSLSRPVIGRARRQTEAATRVFMGDTAQALAGVPSERARLVPRGIDPSHFETTEPSGAPRVLFVGKLERSKGIRELIEAFSLVRASVDGAQLILAGDGPERGWIEHRVHELGLDGSVQMLGPVEHRRIAGLLSETSLLCLPSHGEPFGMAALEAMAAGRAVVGTDTGGLRELVDPVQGGRLVAPRDIGGLAGALVELLNDRDTLIEIGQWNRERVQRDLSLDRMLDRIEDAYQAALA